MPGQNTEHNRETAAKHGTVLVLGHSGFIGAAIAGHLTSHGYNVVGASSKECDLTLPGAAAEFLKSVPGEIAVVFCSSKLRAVGDGYETMVQNLSMVRNFLAEVSSHQMVSLVFLSSTSLYGPKPDIPITASAPARPNNYYDISKTANEFLLRLPGQIDCPVSVLRLPGVYGPGDCGKSVVGRLLTQMREDGKIMLSGDGSSRRDFVQVKDVAEVVRRVIDEPFNGNLNVASGVSLTMLEVVATIGRSAGISPTIEFGPEDSNSPKHLVFDVSDINARFPGLNFTSLEAGTADYVANLDRVLSA